MGRSRVRLLWTALAGALAAVLLISGCGSQSSGGGGTGGGAQAQAPAAKVHLEPGGGGDVNPAAPVKVSVERGKLDDVALTNGDGKEVEGELAADGLSWTAGEQLGYGKTYTWSGEATGTDGQSVPVQGSFTTVSPAKTVRATVNPTDHTEVGVAMPISVKFDQPVTDKAAAERALQVRPSVPVEGAWAWLSDKQVDWRPKEYWPAGTQVEVDANLYGVHYGEGEYGRSDLTTKFSVGRSQIVKADASTHQMIVEQDGKQIASYPASYGKDHDPELNTPNGTYMVMQKNPVEIMDNPRYGYTDVEKKWAVRMSNHGEFIHENEENRANLGKVNTSHGCINLSEADAKAYFDGALIGDPIEVTGAVTTMEPRFDVFDWMIDWEQWQQKSAL
ncbi:Ig-like domain-containing protein [Saccharopolyspora gloriosae]|uniref:Lipoprotein-anchoring transpeptidase ErfK/SrfK n=1 Tax=Saccharopolyspora gloriosae TaxID=455344 RepID=A0A840NF70_9PSEU|nr:lipoprotein-anchoring transpeptidase ErfK/SrfK [Saccharopolyspora gloriosae]